MKPVAAVVLNWNGAADTIACVKSLQQSGYPDLDVVVVDNASSDDSVARIHSDLPGIPIIPCPTNGGYSAGNNVGVRYALARGADYVLILNNDVIVTAGFLRPMVAEAEGDPTVGIVTCDARFATDHARSYPTGGRISFVRGAGVALPVGERSRRSVVDFVSGCILLVRRAVFETVGFLDESFFMYFEDVEFSRRVAKSFQLVYTPDAVVYHRSGGGDSWATQTPTYLHYMARNRFLAFRNEPIAYRAYLILVGCTAAAAKSASILLRTFSSGRVRAPQRQLSALWSGLAAGVRISITRAVQSRPSKMGGVGDSR